MLLTTNMRRLTRQCVAAEKELGDSIISPSANNADISMPNALETSLDTTSSTTFEIPYSNQNIFCTSFGPSAAQLSLIFTHGAGGNLSSPAVVNFAEGFAELKKIVCFQGNMNLQSRTKMFKTVYEHQRCNVLGGRSLGARAAVMSAKETDNVKALILVSYPLRNRKGDVRNQLLLDIDEGIDVLLVVGDRDTMCPIDELRTLVKLMKAKTWLVVVNDANHCMEMRPTKATRAIGKTVGKVVARWIEERDDTLTNGRIHWDEEKSDVVVGAWNDGL